MSQIRWVGYFLVLLVGSAAVTAWAWKPAPPTRFAGLSSDQVPRVVAGMTASADLEQPQEVKEALASAALISRRYTAGLDEIDFSLIGGTDRNALHDPRNCLRGAGMQMENEHTEHLPGTEVDAYALHAVGQPGMSDWDTLMFYIVDGKIVSSVSSTRVAMLESMFLGQSKPVYLLRFERPLDKDPKTAAAYHIRMQRFAAQMWIELRPKLMKSDAAADNASKS